MAEWLFLLKAVVLAFQDEIAPLVRRFVAWFDQRRESAAASYHAPSRPDED